MQSENNEQIEKLRLYQESVIYNSLNVMLELQAVTIFVVFLSELIGFITLISFFNMSICSLLLFTSLIFINNKPIKIKYFYIFKIYISCSAIISIILNVFEFTYIIVNKLSNKAEIIP
jgi:hypothetical protein